MAGAGRWGGAPVPVYVAAMGPKALQVTGELADGTLPNLAGPRTIEEFIEPAVLNSAADAARPKPRIIAQVPAIPSDNVDGGKKFRGRAIELLRGNSMVLEGDCASGCRQRSRPCRTSCMNSCRAEFATMPLNGGQQSRAWARR
jgi:hypothetical protein